MSGGRRGGGGGSGGGGVVVVPGLPRPARARGRSMFSNYVHYKLATERSLKIFI